MLSVAKLFAQSNITKFIIFVMMYTYSSAKPDIMRYKYKKETSHENQNPFNHPASNIVILLMPN
jgi:hypothetical protein